MRANGMNTPWGRADDTKVIERGLSYVTTPGHGGFSVTERFAERNLSAAAIARGLHWGNKLWYEEDVDWAIVAFEIPSARPSNVSKEDVWRTLSGYHPDYLREVGETPDPKLEAEWKRWQEHGRMRTERDPDLVTSAVKLDDNIVRVATADGQQHLVTAESYRDRDYHDFRLSRMEQVAYSANASKSVEKVLRAAEQKRYAAAGAFHTAGGIVYSYDMPIADLRGDMIMDFRILDKKRSPSATTSKHIGYLLREYPRAQVVSDLGMVPNQAGALRVAQMIVDEVNELSSGTGIEAQPPEGVPPFRWAQENESAAIEVYTVHGSFDVLVSLFENDEFIINFWEHGTASRQLGPSEGDRLGEWTPLNLSYDTSREAMEEAAADIIEVGEELDGYLVEEMDAVDY